MKWVAGLDGCRAGWIACVWGGPGTSASATLLTSLAHAEAVLPRGIAALAVDVPMGLPEGAERGGRECDRLARRLLGRRRSSVFAPPARHSLAAATHAEASRLNRASSPLQIGVSLQAFAIFEKIRDAEAALAGSPWLRDQAIEVHPEVCFAEMAGGQPLQRKKSAAGKAERRRWLEHVGFVELTQFEAEARRLGAAVDDALDACAAAWTALRRAEGEARCLPPNAESAPCSMRIWI
jgi:predicted RNase H-like nuclease